MKQEVIGYIMPTEPTEKPTKQRNKNAVLIPDVVGKLLISVILIELAAISIPISGDGTAFIASLFFCTGIIGGGD